MNVLVSACLLGVACRYDGQSRPCPMLQNLPPDIHLIPVCPEILGGLPTPRISAERVNHTVRTKDGRDVTAAYRRGAEEVLRLARIFNCRAAILKERSPSCGNGQIYDGTFSHTLTSGTGITSELLMQNGITVFGETQLADFAAEIRKGARADGPNDDTVLY